MVISGVNTVTYNGDGVTTAWPYTFPVTDDSEIRVQLNNADGTAVIIESDYYVDLINSTVYYPGYAPGSEPPEAEQPPKVQTGQTITVYREIPITQESDLGEKWPFEVIEKGLDKLTMIAQQIDSGTKRTIDNALASMFQLAGIVTDSGKLQHITDQYNDIDSNAEVAYNAASTAVNAASSALTSKGDASASASIAQTTASALISFLQDKETLSAPAVDDTLSIEGAAADSQVVGKDISIIADAEDGVLRSITDGHFWKIVPTGWTDMMRYQENDGVISERPPVIKAHDYMLCPKNMCVITRGNDARAYLYFYQIVGGTYTPVWDVLNVTVLDGTKNYLNADNAAPYMITDIPDDTYFRFVVTAGKVNLYGWDGELFDGLPVVADCAYPTGTGKTRYIMPPTAFGMTVPGCARYLLTTNDVMLGVVFGYSGDSVIKIIDKNERFLELPQGYDFFRVRLWFKDNVYKTLTGDLSSYVVAFNKQKVFKQTTTARASDIQKNAEHFCNITWTPKADVPINNKNSYAFNADVEYNGTPYSEDWLTAHFVGWHITTHTFVNAINDEDSVFYNETVADGQPYYGNVCSSFGSLVAGFPYPQTNAGFAYDPNVITVATSEPSLGQPFSDLSHCYIPVEKTTYADRSWSVSIYDQTRPVCAKLTRYSVIDRAHDYSGYLKSHGMKNNGYSWFDTYGYSCWHIEARADMSNNPYADSDIAIVNGDARPYKGDKCVYTSNDDHVYINIKNNATTLYLRMGEEGNTTAIPTDGATQIDVKPYLNGNGIYYVYTDTNVTEESFEYIIPAVVTVNLVSGKITSTTGSFWYLTANMEGNKMRPSVGRVCIPMLSDYTEWNAGGVLKGIFAVFGKGTYGAYNIPFVVQEHEDEPVDPEDPGGDDPGDE